MSGVSGRLGFGGEPNPEKSGREKEELAGYDVPGCFFATAAAEAAPSGPDNK